MGDTVCQIAGGVCNQVEQSKLTSAELLEKAMLSAGYSCSHWAGNRGYAGTPFADSRQGNCVWLSSGAKSVCNGNHYSHHQPLCYCDLPTETPTRRPTSNPTRQPTPFPSMVPTNVPTTVPIMSPTNVPTAVPTITPTPGYSDTPTGNAPDKCKDKFPWCPFLEFLDNCDDADFRLYCPFTCGHCSTESPTSWPTASPNEDSADTFDILEGVIDYLFNYILQCKEHKESSDASM